MGQKDICYPLVSFVSNLVSVKNHVWYKKPDTYYQCNMLHLNGNIFTELHPPHSMANLQILPD